MERVLSTERSTNCHSANNRNVRVCRSRDEAPMENGFDGTNAVASASTFTLLHAEMDA
jgi:hypothetical protein